MIIRVENKESEVRNQENEEKYKKFKRITIRGKKGKW